MILLWTALRPSAIEQRWRTAAIMVVTAVCAAVTVAGLVRDPRHPALLWAGIVGGVTATLVSIRWQRPPQRLEIAIDDEGYVRVRSIGEPAAPAERALRAVFGAPWLISLSDGTILYTVWPDSLPADAFRRLWVCVRWARATRNTTAGAPGARAARSPIHDDPS